MKKLLTGITLSAILITLACNQSSKFTPRSWDYVITQQTTKHNLDSLVSAWKNDSIDLKFSNIQFDSLGKLFKVEGSVYLVSMGKDVSGTFSQDSLGKKPIEIKLDNAPSVSIGIKK
jgi:hypothetical protein